jgi:ABC-type uncharacterized transport system auxiliary subunit
VVRGTIRRLEQVVGDKSGTVISLELAVIEKSNDKLILSKVYTSEKPISGDKIDDAVTALNDGLDEVFATFAADLSSAKL